MDSILVAWIHYTVLGLSEDAMTYTAAFSCMGEFFYHMNIRTPEWLGYLIQRPESHRIHHLRDSQYLSRNYSDLPLWDMLFGTFENPPANTDWSKLKFGFPEEDELRLGEMLVNMRNVRRPGTPWSKVLLHAYLHHTGPRVNHVVSVRNITPSPRVAAEKTLVFWAWLVMAIAYTASGLDKLSSASWVDGSALRHVLSNPLARDNGLRDALLATPPMVLQMGTWMSLAAEIAFVPATWFRATRKFASLALIAMHLGIIAVINFTDLTVGVLTIHVMLAPSLLLGTRWEGTWVGRYQSWLPVFRVLLGAYLLVHFLQLVPYAGDLFSTTGMFPDAARLPTAGFPNVFTALGSAAAVRAGVMALAALSVALMMVPRLRSLCCVALWYGWAALWNRNPWISNPGMPFVGWVLLAMALWQEEEEDWEDVPAPPAPLAATTDTVAPPKSPDPPHVHRKPRWTARSYVRLAAINALGVWGCVQVVAYYLHIPALRAVSAATVASPLPLVFGSFSGHETFSNAYHFHGQDVTGQQHAGIIDSRAYSRLRAAYNYRNTFGVALAYGPFFTTPQQLEQRDAVLRYGFCRPGHLVWATNITGGAPLRWVTISVSPRNPAGHITLPDSGDNATGDGGAWTMSVQC